MNYEMFREQLIAAIEELTAGEETVVLRSVPKNNGTVLEGISICEPGCVISPTVCPDAFYELFLAGVPVRVLAGRVVGEYRRCRQEVRIDQKLFENFENVRGDISARVISRERNEAYLEELPHDEILDLAAVYCIEMRLPGISRASVMIRWQDLARWEIPQEEVREAARRNMPVRDPVRVELLEQMLKQMSEEGVCDPVFHMEDPMPLYVMTNRSGMYGASVILYDNVFAPIAGSLRADLYILPRSIHELILLPDTGLYMKEELEEMVSQVNRTQLAPEEVLSDRVYRYSRVSGELYL